MCAFGRRGGESSGHRVCWRVEEKGRIVEASNKLAIAGLFFLAVSIASVALLVSDYIFERATSIATTTALGALLAVLWYVFPVASRRRRAR